MKRIDAVAYPLFLLIIAFLGWRGYTLSHENTQLKAAADAGNLFSTNTGRAVLPELVGLTLSQQNVSSMSGAEMSLLPAPSDAEKRLYLLIFYTLADCARCYEEMPFWNELQKIFGSRMEVLAVVTGGDPKRFNYFNNERQLQIPVYYDAEGYLFDQLGLLNTGLTPVKVLVDADGTVLHAARTTYDIVEAQNQYLAALSGIIHSMKSKSG